MEKSRTTIETLQAGEAVAPSEVSWRDLARQFALSLRDGATGMNGDYSTYELCEGEKAGGEVRLAAEN